MRWLRSPEPTRLLRSAGPLVLLFLHLDLVDAGGQHAERFVLVLVLALFVLALDDDAGFVVRQPDGRGGFVDVLAAGAAGAERVVAVVVGLEVDFDVFRLGQHGHGGGRGVDAALVSVSGTRCTRWPPLSYCSSR